MLTLKKWEFALSCVALSSAVACGGEAADENGTRGSGGDSGSGGSASAGGSSSGGSASGGSPAAGGASSGGAGGGTDGAGGSMPGENRDVTLNIDATIGFDESPGADLAIAVDETAGLAMIVAIKYERPFSSGDFTINGEPVTMASEYAVTPPVERLTDFITSYPLVGAAVTDVAGIRTMNVDVTAILLEGDLQSTTPSAVYVAHAGTITLFRNDGLYDLEGNLDFTQVSGLGSGAVAVADPVTIDLQNFYFEYDIGFF